jgi:tetratricopeptide (TPR) repeat protein
VGGPPPPTEAQRKAFEEATGRRLPTPEGGRRLRALLMEGAQKLGRGDHLGAAQAYRGAQDLCRAEGLVAEEAMVLVAIASLALATGSPDRAREAYERAASLAEGITLWQVVAQAWMGVGGVFLVAQQYLPAAAAYERAAEAAEKAKVDLLRIESLRMAGTCHLSVGDEREATRCWRAAVETGQASDPATREAGTFGQTAEALAALLDRRGLTQQAAHVRAMVKARA